MRGLASFAGLDGSRQQAGEIQSTEKSTWCSSLIFIIHVSSSIPRFQLVRLENIKQQGIPM
jgi:hypothetical protein